MIHRRTPDQMTERRPTSRRSHRPASGADSEAAYDLSMERVPSEWVDAQDASPLGNGDPFHRRRSSRFAVVPEDHGSPFVTNVIAAGVAFGSVATWYFLEVLGIYRGPWIPVVAAVVIGIVVRFAGLEDPNYRLIVAVSTYLLAVLVALILITHRDLRAIYGSYGLAEFETLLIANRFAEVGRALALAAGAVLAPSVAVLGHGRH